MCVLDSVLLFHSGLVFVAGLPGMNLQVRQECMNWKSQQMTHLGEPEKSLQSELICPYYRNKSQHLINPYYTL